MGSKENLGNNGDQLVGTTTNPTSVNDSLIGVLSSCDTLKNLATDKEGLSRKMKDANTLEISAGGIYKRDNVIDAGNNPATHMREIGKELHKMFKRGEKFSVNVKAFVGKEYLLARIENFPKFDIGEAVEDACHARAFRGEGWIKNPYDHAPEPVPVSIEPGTFVSDKHSLTYTIKFGDKE